MERTAPAEERTLPARRPRTASLATRIVTVTIGIVGVTVLVSSALALVGVYRLSRQQEAAHLSAYRQIIFDDLTARLTTAERVIDSLAAGLGAHPLQREATARTLGTAALSNAESFDLLTVVDATGTVLAQYPPARNPVRVPGNVLAQGAGAAAVGSTVFSSDRPADDPKETVVWLVQSFPVGEARLLLVGRMQRGFAQRLVNDVAERDPRRAAMVIDGTGRVVASGIEGPRLDIRSVRFDSSRQGMGTTRGLTSPGIGEMNAYWARLSAAPGLDWRVVVAEPAMAALVRERDALLPASLTVLAAALLATWVSVLFARRIVQPLHQFERRAREVVSGRVVSPLEVDRRDELGRLADAFNAMLVRLNALRELSSLLARSTRLDEVLRGTLAATSRLLGADVVPAVFLLDELRRRLVLAAVPSVPGLTVEASLDVGDESWAAGALRSAEPVVFSVDDLEAGSEATRVLREGGVRSGLALQLAVGEEPMGVLVALSLVEREFSEAEREMLRTFAAQAALAIENSRLFEEERKSRGEAEALREVAEELESTPDLRGSLERVASIAAALLDADCLTLALSTEPALSLEPLVDPSFEAWDALFGAHASADSHRPVVVPGGGGTRVGPVTEDHGPLMLIPLVQAGRRRGMLVLECGDAARGFSDRQLTLAATIGREVSLALENAYLLHQARSRAINLETIFRISQAVSSSLQSTVVLNRVLDVVQKIFSAEAVSLMTFEPIKRTIVTAMARGIPDRDMLYFEATPGEDLPGRVFESGRAEVFYGLAAMDTPLARMASEAGFRSVLAVPLLARGRSTGVLSIYSAEADSFDAGDVELLQTFASQAALAIDTAQLYGREHRVASVLQASILPETLPVIEGLDVASVYRPAAQEAEIGGDYYDVFVAPDGRVAVVIADVAGKGVFAATKTSMIRYSLRGMVAAGLGPSAAIGELNRMVAEAGDASDIVTIWVGFLDIGQRTLTFADAGHPPGLLLQPEQGSIERLLPTGPILGGIPRAEYREESVPLDRGATLILYTDGVTEARAGGKFFGEGRIRRALKAGGTAERVAERLMVAVDRFAGGGLRDDAAVLVVGLSEAGDVGRKTV